LIEIQVASYAREKWLDPLNCFSTISVMVRMDAIKRLLTTPAPPELGPGRRGGTQSEAEVNRALNDLVGGQEHDQRLQLIRAVVLVWHDHLDAAHVIAQDVPGADGALVHGIMHRREPDYGNAKYWFRRAGKHAIFHELAKQAGALLDSKGESVLKSKLILGDDWDAFKFVDLCEEAAGGSAAEARVLLLRECQAIELRVLVEWLGEL
jgi:hypothetical protein